MRLPPSVFQRVDTEKGPVWCVPENTSAQARYNLATQIASKRSVRAERKAVPQPSLTVRFAIWKNNKLKARIKMLHEEHVRREKIAEAAEQEKRRELQVIEFKKAKRRVRFQAARWNDKFASVHHLRIGNVRLKAA